MVHIFVFSQLPTCLKPEINNTQYLLQVVFGAERAKMQAISRLPMFSDSSSGLIPCLRSQVEYDGLTGRVEFNSKGQRTNYTLHILEKHKSGHKQVRHIHVRVSSPCTVLILNNAL